MNEWISVDDKPIPKDNRIKIIRWNKFFQCAVTVSYEPEHNKNMPWVTGDKSHLWSEETFTPHWMPLLEPPKQKEG